MSNQKNAATLKQFWDEQHAHNITQDHRRKMIRTLIVAVRNGFVNTKYDGHHVFIDQHGVVIGITFGSIQHKTIPILNIYDKHPIYITNVCYKAMEFSADIV